MSCLGYFLCAFVLQLNATSETLQCRVSVLITPISGKNLEVLPRRDGLMRVPWTLDTKCRTLYINFTVGSRLLYKKVRCVFLLATRNRMVEQGEFRVTNGLTFLAAEVSVMKGGYFGRFSERYW